MNILIEKTEVVTLSIINLTLRCRSSLYKVLTKGTLSRVTLLSLYY